MGEIPSTAKLEVTQEENNTVRYSLVDGDVTMGFIRVELPDLMDLREECTIKLQLTQPEFRGRGVITRLLSETLTDLKNQGYYTVYAYIPSCLKMTGPKGRRYAQTRWEPRKAQDNGGYRSLKPLLNAKFNDETHPQILITRISRKNADEEGVIDVGVGIEISLKETGIPIERVEDVVARIVSSYETDDEITQRNGWVIRATEYPKMLEIQS